MSENRDAGAPAGKRSSPEAEDGPSAKRGFGNMACAIGILLAIVGIVIAFVANGAPIALGALGAVLGVVGYALGVRRLGVVTVVLCVAAAFFGLMASQGLIPGMQATDQSYPEGAEPASKGSKQN